MSCDSEHELGDDHEHDRHLQTLGPRSLRLTVQHRVRFAKNAELPVDSSPQRPYSLVSVPSRTDN